MPGTTTIYRPANPDSPDPVTAQTLVLALPAPLNVSTTKTVTVVSALAATGVDILPTLGMGAIPILAGAGLTVIARRRLPI